jgi:hypothetical protein
MVAGTGGLVAAATSEETGAAGRWIGTGIKLPSPRPNFDCVAFDRSSDAFAMTAPLHNVPRGTQHATCCATTRAMLMRATSPPTIKNSTPRTVHSPRTLFLISSVSIMLATRLIVISSYAK